MLENPALPSGNFSSPITNSSKESSPNISPSSQPALPLNLKIPQKTSVLFQITITICKHWSKFGTCGPSHGDFGGVSRPQKHSYKVFDYVEWNGSLEFWSGDCGKIISVGGGLDTFQFFGHLKRALELFISVRMSPLARFSDHWVDTITPGKKKQTKKQTNKHASVICLQAKNTKFHISVDRSLKLLQ